MCKNIASFLKFVGIVVFLVGWLTDYYTLITGLIALIIIWIIAIIVSKHSGVCKPCLTPMKSRKPVRRAVKRKSVKSKVKKKKRKTAKKKKRR